MRPLPLATWLTVGSVSVLGIIAALDAAERRPHFRGEERVIGNTRTGAEVGQPAASDYPGDLYAAEPNCRIARIDLRSGQTQYVGRGCAFSDPGLDPTATLRASCRHRFVELQKHTGEVVLRFPGCSPSWSPQGSLAYAREGKVLRYPHVVLLGPRHLQRLFPQSKTVGVRISIEGLAWISEELIAVAAGLRSNGHSRHALGIFHAHRLVRSASLRKQPTRLRVSPLERFVSAIHSGLPETVVVPVGDGPVRRYPGASAIAWAPDESAVAVASTRGIAVRPLEPGRGAPLLAALQAADLSWRS